MNQHISDYRWTKTPGFWALQLLTHLRMRSVLLYKLPKTAGIALDSPWCNKSVGFDSAKSDVQTNGRDEHMHLTRIEKSIFDSPPRIWITDIEINRIRSQPDSSWAEPSPSPDLYPESLYVQLTGLDEERTRSLQKPVQWLISRRPILLAVENKFKDNYWPTLRRFV